VIVRQVIVQVQGAGADMQRCRGGEEVVHRWCIDA